MDFFSKISRLSVFSGMSGEEIRALNFCLKAKLKSFNKSEIILEENTPLDCLLIVVSGSARTISTTEFGEDSIISEYKVGQIYGAEEAFVKKNTYNFKLVASTNCEILFVNKTISLKKCENNCKRHQVFIDNILNALAKKNLELCERINQMTRRSIREKVLAYLQDKQKENKSTYFDIPYNRQELADYLSVDRSALSNELSKLKKENVIDYNKNHFQLKNTNKP